MGNLVRKRQHKDLILSLITPIIWILPLPAALVHQSGLRACLERDGGHLDRYRQIQRPVKTWEQMREELIVRLLLGRPTPTREKAAEQIDAF